MQERLLSLAVRLPDTPNPGEGRQAAVAIILQDEHVLLMRRVERENDRWSGQVSLPGGHQDPEDASLLATAMRETLEEVSLDLCQHARFLGCMPGMQARAGGGRLPMWITPFLFEANAPLAPNPGPEASSTFWLPLPQAHSGELDQPYTWSSPEGLQRKLPSWRFDGHKIWGMTHHLLSQLNAELFDV